MDKRKVRLKWTANSSFKKDRGMQKASNTD